MLLYESVCNKYNIPLNIVELRKNTKKLKEWDPATGKTHITIVDTQTGETLAQMEEQEDEDEYDPFATGPEGASSKGVEDEGKLKKIDCALLGISVSTLFEYPVAAL